MVNDADEVAESVMSVPLNIENWITTLAARMSSVAQVTSLWSMTVPATVMVHDPVYAVSTALAGTPVLPGPGQQPPHRSAPPGTLVPATGQPAGLGDGDGLGVVGVGDGVVGVGEGVVGVGDGLGDGEGDGLGLGDGEGLGDGKGLVTATQSVSQFFARVDRP
jgi:hypothetical protein